MEYQDRRLAPDERVASFRLGAMLDRMSQGLARDAHVVYSRFGAASARIGRAFAPPSLAMVCRWLALMVLVGALVWGLVWGDETFRRVLGLEGPGRVWSIALAVLLPPVTFLIGPLYALVAWGTWEPILVCYGGLMAGSLLWAVGDVLAGQR